MCPPSVPDIPKQAGVDRVKGFLKNQSHYLVSQLVSQMSEDYEKCGQKLEIETNAMHEGNVYL